MKNVLLIIACGYMAGMLYAGHLEFEDLERFFKKRKHRLKIRGRPRVVSNSEIDQIIKIIAGGIACAAGRRRLYFNSKRVVDLADELGSAVSYGEFTPQAIAKLCGTRIEVFKKIQEDLLRRSRFEIDAELQNHTVN